MLKDTLIEANQYEPVVSILKDLLTHQYSAYPLSRCIVEDDAVSWEVPADKVSEEALAVLEAIDDPSETNYYLPSIHRLADDTVDIMLHNHANALTHRNEPADSLDSIRSWQVLAYLIFFLSSQEGLREDYGASYQWEIPDGWKLEDHQLALRIVP